MSKVIATLKRLKQIVATLEKFKDTEAVSPESGFIYQTFNDSLVYVFKDSDDDFVGIVLKGGHGVTRNPGEKPGETYSIDEDGYSAVPGEEDLVMSLAKKLEIVLP